MERLIGQNLRGKSRQDRHAPRAARVLSIAIDVADAFDAREQHRAISDVEAENIFSTATRTGRRRPSPTSIVRLLDRKASRTTGKFIGTLRYASPEQITGSAIVLATDIYSLAASCSSRCPGRGRSTKRGRR
ncbi:MAG: hypothetical protein KF764_12090 [Labilithrix sp.]|nr:hypothetical protein [Labilithrix sp.]